MSRYLCLSNGVLGIGDSPFADVDAYQMMIDLGCNEVGELDGGGSATIWSESCPSLQNFFKGGMTAHGGYVNAYRDSSPREIACGLFVMPPPASPTVRTPTLFAVPSATASVPPSMV